MKVLQIIEENINARHIEEIASVLRDGGIIVYPTDTVYAIGCDALNNQAIERICSLKAMKSAKTNLSIICSDISEVAQYAKFDNTQFRLMKNNLPATRLPQPLSGNWGIPSSPRRCLPVTTTTAANPSSSPRRWAVV